MDPLPDARRGWARRAQLLLQLFVAFLCGFHLVVGLALSFSADFQIWITGLYAPELEATPQTTYLVRVLGTFAFAMGLVLVPAVRDPQRHWAVIAAFITFFVLRNLSRHLYADELYAGFGVSPAVNLLTSVFFTLQIFVLIGLLLATRRPATSQPAADA